MSGTFCYTLPVKAVRSPIGYGGPDHGNDGKDEEIPFKRSHRHCLHQARRPRKRARRLLSLQRERSTTKLVQLPMDSPRSAKRHLRQDRKETWQCSRVVDDSCCEVATTIAQREGETRKATRLPCYRLFATSLRAFSSPLGGWGETHLSFPSPQVPAVLTNAPGDGEGKVFIS